MQEFNPFAGGIDILDRQARRVAAGPRQACDKSAADWVADAHKYYWDDRCRSLGRDCRRSCTREDDIDLKSD